MRPRSNLFHVKSGINLKDFNTHRTTKSMVKLCERNNGMDKDTFEILQVIYLHIFAGHVSTYFLHTFTYIKYG